MTTTTDLGGFGRYVTGSRTVTDHITPVLGDFADDFDIPGLADAYRAAVNAHLDEHGITLVGDDFYGTVPVPDNADELIQEALEQTDITSLLADYESTTD